MAAITDGRFIATRLPWDHSAPAARSVATVSDDARNLTPLTAVRAAPVRTDSNRAFTLAVAVSIALHTALLAATSLGNQDRNGMGADEAAVLGIEIITEAELASFGGVAAAAVAPPVIDQRPEIEPAETTPPDAVPPESASEPDEVPPPTRVAELPPVETSPPPIAPAAPPQMASLETAPAPATEAIVRPGRGTLDRYARDVRLAIGRALPPHAGRAGRVDVRFGLSETGTVAFAEVLGATVDDAVSRRVLAAVRQARYPVPPIGANETDRQFSIAFEFR